MKKTILVLILGFISAGLGFSLTALPISPLTGVPGPAEIEITGGTESPPGKLVTLKPSGVDDCRVLWVLNYPADFVEWTTENGKLFLAMPPQSVCFSLVISPNNSDEPIRTIRHLITTGQKTEPNDEPNDDPAPDPIVRFTKTDFLVLVEESGERGVDVAKLVNSKFWQQEITAAGYNGPLVYDKDSEQGKAFLTTAKTFNMPAELPFLAIMSADGDFLESFPVLTVENLKRGLGFE